MFRAKSAYTYLVVIAICIFPEQIHTQTVTTDAMDYYIGGVVEFPAPSSRAYTANAIKQRIQRMRVLLETTPIRPDIVVFPERVLNNRTQPIIVPAPKTNNVPCGAIHPVYDYIITEISCYARSLNMYLLINVVEVENCTVSTTPMECEGMCGKNQCAIYNTNVVFDRAGVVISRYRKYNLIGDEWLYYNYTLQPEQEATFHTDFNVTFGHFTRMDVLYYRPAQALVERGIKNFLHPSKWQSELPFMTAVQLHQAWAYSNDVNLLVAGTNDPRNGLTGSGIYAGKQGALLAAMTGDEKRSKLHLSVIPKQHVTNEHSHSNPQISTKNFNKHLIQNINGAVNSKATLNSIAQNRFTGVQLARDKDIDLYKTKPLNNDDGLEIQEKLCHNELCCDFLIARSLNKAASAAIFSEVESSNSSYFYRIATFRGEGTFLNTEPDSLSVCALFACVDDHLYSCGRIFGEETNVVPMYTFDSIRIQAKFATERSHLIMSTSVDSMLMPLPVEAFDWQVQKFSNFTFVNFTLLQPRANLLTFGIYVNYFLDETEYDQHQPDNSLGTNLIPHSTTIAFVILKSLEHL